MDGSSSESESVGLVVRHALSAISSDELNSWIVDSGATCHSKKQKCVALSTAEAEYMALSSAAQEVIWIPQLTKNSKNNMTAKEPIVIYEDNQSAICMAKNPQFHGRTKHIEIKYHFIRDQVKIGAIELMHYQTGDMLADMFTKGLQ